MKTACKARKAFFMKTACTLVRSNQDRGTEMALAPNIMNGEIACVHGIIVLLHRHVGIMVIMATCKTSYTFLTLYFSWLTFFSW